MCAAADEGDDVGDADGRWWAEAARRPCRGETSKRDSEGEDDEGEDKAADDED